MRVFKTTDDALKLSPHHIVNFVDRYREGIDTTSYVEYFWLGAGVELRVKETLEKLLENPNVYVEIVNNVREDFICSTNGPKRPECFFLTNISLAGCASRDAKGKERKIAAEMGIKIGKVYLFSELVEKRELTPYGKERK